MVMPTTYTTTGPAGAVATMTMAVVAEVAVGMVGAPRL